MISQLAALASGNPKAMLALAMNLDGFNNRGCALDQVVASRGTGRVDGSRI